MATLYYESSFAHHGIKGQKWGVRRYQNPDGTLTAKGKKKYQKYLGEQLLNYQKKSNFNKEDAAETEKLTKAIFVEKADAYKGDYKKIAKAAKELEKLENAASDIRTNKELRRKKAEELAHDFYQEETGRPLHLESREIQEREIKKYYDGEMSGYMENLYATTANWKNGIGDSYNSKFRNIDDARRYYGQQIRDSSRNIANGILSEYGGERVYGPSGALEFDNSYTATIKSILEERAFSSAYLEDYQKRTRIGE